MSNLSTTIHRKLLRFRPWRKFRNWLIHRLGGYLAYEGPINIKVVDRCNIVTMQSRVEVSMWQFESVGQEGIESYVKKRLADEIMKKMSEDGFIETTRIENPHFNSVIFCARLKLVKPSEKDLQSGEDKQ